VVQALQTSRVASAPAYPEAEVPVLRSFLAVVCLALVAAGPAAAVQPKKASQIVALTTGKFDLTEGGTIEFGFSTQAYGFLAPDK
jgi:hypothetical protein